MITGILIESREGPVWLYGTSSEHAILYQYNIFGAKNIVMAMVSCLTIFVVMYEAKFLCFCLCY